MQARVLFRIAAILFLTVFALVENGTDILLPWHPLPTYGFSSSPSGRVTAVDVTAAKGGLRVGDVIDIARLTPLQRMTFRFVTVARQGGVLELPLRTGRTVFVPAHVYSRTLSDNVTDVIVVLAMIAYIILAAVLVLLRPSPATWAFYIFSFPFCNGGTMYLAYFPLWMLTLMSVVLSASLPASAAAFLSFALRFPNEKPHGIAAAAERAALFVIAPALAAYLVAELLSAVFLAHVLSESLLHTTFAIIFVVYAGGIAALLARFASADASTKNRLRWVVVAFSIAFLPVLGELFLENVWNVFAEVTYINLFQTFTLLAPIALAYTILKHRLFDIRLVISRALLYAVLTSIVVALLALVDWAFGRWLAESRFAFIAELALAVVIGITITSVHRYIERFLNAVIFRSQELSMQALRRFAHETDLIADPNHLMQQSYEVLRTRLESEYNAIYTLDGSSYAIATPQQSGLPTLIAGHDLAVLRLRRWHEPFECDERAHAFFGALLLPMTSRGSLIGFVVCGPKRDHTHYLSEEIETLSLLTHRVSSTYALLMLAASATLMRPAESGGSLS